MCANGKQTITKECYQELLRIARKPRLTNWEARRLLRERGSCLATNPQSVAAAV